MARQSKRRRQHTRGTKQCSASRVSRPWFEALEPRLLLTSGWQNTEWPADVNRDGKLSPIDALLVVNELNNGWFSGPLGHLPPRASAPDNAPCVDTNGDFRVTPLDALLVINALSQEDLPSASTYANTSAEFRVNSYVPGQQDVWDQTDAVIVRPDGSFVVTFSGKGIGDNSGVFLRRFGASGSPIGEDQLVNTDTTGPQTTPVIAGNAAGDFIIAWAGHGASDANGIYFQRYRADGAPLGMQRMANATTAGNQESPAVGLADDGSFVVAWEGKGTDDAHGVFVRRFDSSGIPAGPEQRVNVTTAGSQRQPQLAMAPDGQFAVAWYGQGAGDNLGIFVRRYDHQARPVGGEIRVNQTTVGPQTSPALAINSTGRLAVAWESHGPDNRRGIFVRQLHGDSTFVGNELRASSNVSDPAFAPAIALGADHSSIVVWTAEGSRSIVVQVLDPQGLKVGGEQVANTTLQGPRSNPSVSIHSSGAFTVVWSGNGVGDVQGVFGRLFPSGESDQEAPLIFAKLAHDTGTSAFDRVTSNATITGLVHDASPIVSFRAGFDGVAEESFVDLLADLQADGSFVLEPARLEQIYGGPFPDGAHVLHLVAADDKGNTSGVFELGFVLDTTPPAVPVFALDPDFDSEPIGDSQTTFSVVRLVGQTEEDAEVILSPQGLTTTAESAGFFSFPSVPLAMGHNQFTTQAIDLAGNSSTYTSSITLVEACGTENDFVEWTFAQHGGSGGGQGGVTIETGGGRATLREGDSFLVTFSRTFVVPAAPSRLSFDYSELVFDTTGTNFIQDAFEAALLDAHGNTLVSTIGAGRDAFFNVTEGQAVALGAQASLDDHTLSLDISAITPGTVATLVLRLVNNDDDQNTSVRLSCVHLPAADGASEVLPVAVPQATASRAPSTIDAASLSNLSASLEAQYGRTSWNEPRALLHADVAIHNQGTYPVDGPLLVAIRNFSEPGIRARNFTGLLPDGTPYYDASQLLVDGSLDPSLTTEQLTLTFHNPARAPFTYDLVFLGQVNRPPQFTSSPILEGLAGRSYSYPASASDADGDALTFALLAGPAGMQVNPETGATSWSPQPSDLGNHAVVLQVYDGRGGIARQSYSVGVIDPPPNRPPIINSVPLVQAAVGEPYAYPVKAIDPDGDPLEFALQAPATAMSIDSQTGLIHWIPSPSQLGIHAVHVSVTDGQGGEAIQTFAIQVLSPASNRPPMIVSEPGLAASVARGYAYQIVAIDPDGDSLTYSLAGPAPAGVSIDEQLGLLHWVPTAAQAGEHPITVQVFDGRGGLAEQEFLVVVQGGPGNLPPSITNPTSIAEVNTLPFTFQVTATDPDGDEIGFELLSGPTNMELDSSTGVVTWNPTNLLKNPSFESIATRPIVTTQAVLPDDWQPFFDTPDTWSSDGSYGITPGQFQEWAGYTAQDGLRWVAGAWFAPSGQEEIYQQLTEPLEPGQTYFMDGYQLQSVRSNYNYPGGFQVLAASSNIKATAQTVLLGQFAPTSSGAWTYSSFQFTAPNVGFALSHLVLRPYRQSTNGQTYPGLDNVRLFEIGPFTVSAQDDSGGSDQRTFTFDMQLEVAGLSGHVFGDFDGDGQRAADEPGLGGWTVYIDADNNGKLDEGEAVTTTNPYGYYQFAGLAAGTHLIRVDVSAGWEQTAPPASFHSVTVAPGGWNASLDFGVRLLPSGPNQPPEFVSTPPAVATPRAQWRYQAVAEDPDGDVLTYDLVVRPEGMAVVPHLGVVAWEPLRNQIGAHQAILRVRDGRGGVALQPFEVTVVPPNSAPIITSSPPLQGVAGLPYQYPVRAQDADGDPLQYSLENAPTGMTIGAASGILHWDSPSLGAHGATIVVSDGRGSVAQQTYSLQVVLDAPNDPPTIVSSPRLAALLGQTYRYRVEVVDPNGDPLHYGLDQAPAGMTISSGGLIEWLPAPARLGEHNVSIHVADGRGGVATQNFALQVSTNRVNASPTIVSTPSTNVILGDTFAYDAVATDQDGDLLIWDLVDAPAGMSVDAERGRVRWLPGSDQLGSHSVTLSVLDGHGGVATQSFQLSVHALNRPPQFTTVPSTQAAVGQLYSYAAGAYDADGDNLLFWHLGPDGMTIDPVTGLLTWTPDAAPAVYDINVFVSDGQAVTNQVYKLFVGTTPFNYPPIITSTPPFAAETNQPYLYQLTAFDPEGDELQWSLSEFPSGMQIGSQGWIHWTPTAVQTGESYVTAEVMDAAGGQSSQRFNVFVRSNAAPSIHSQPPLSLARGATYVYDVIASDPDGDPLEYRLASGPASMTIDDLGRVRWSPGDGDQGSYELRIEVSDDRGATAAQQFQLAVIPDTNAPRVQVTISANPAALGSNVDFLVEAVDDVAVVSRGLTVGGLPVVLDPSGWGTVAMSTPGPVAVVATASDAAGNVGQATGELLVLDPFVFGAPLVEITSPAETLDPATSLVTAPLDVIGTVDDPDLLFYTLSLAPWGSRNFVELARGETNVLNGNLGRLDPSLLENDLHVLQLYAIDSGGNESEVETVISVAGNLKLGNFTLSFTDLVVPVSGIPIVMTRTYDTLAAGRQQDFGFGWRLDIVNTDLRAGVSKTGFEDVLIFKPYYYNARVYVTVPGEGRQGFTFQPELAPGLRGGFLGIWYPRFVPDAGVTSRLSVPQYDLYNNDGEFVGYNTSLPYNPANPAFGSYFTLTTQEGVSYRIDGMTGQADRISDRNGNALTISSDGISSTSGPAIVFERDPLGRITSVIDPLGNRLQYAYAQAGDLAQVTDREGHATSFVYLAEPAHYLEQVIDPLGRTGIRSVYNDEGRLVRMIDAGGHEIELVYDADNFLHTIHDQLGNSTIYEYDALGNIRTEIYPDGGQLLRTFSDANNPLSPTTISHILADGTELVTSFTYDTRGNILSVVDPAGNKRFSTWDSIGNRLASVDPLGHTTTRTYDSTGNQTAVTFPDGLTASQTVDASGNMTSLLMAGVATHLEYDATGRVTRRIDNGGAVTEFTYDANGNRLTETLSYQLASGPVNVVTATAYDNSGRVIHQTVSQNGDLLLSTSNQFDAAGNLVTQTDGLGRTTRFVYDDRGLRVQLIFPDDTSDDDSDNPHIIDEYDARGRLIARTDEAGRVTRFIHDALGRLTETIYPDDTPGDDDNPRTRTEYDLVGHVIAEIDELGHRTEFRYDLAGNLIEIVLADDTPDNLADNPRQTFDYDAAGRRIASTDPLGRTTHFLFADSGLVTEVILPGSGEWVSRPRFLSEYDEHRRLASTTDPTGRSTYFAYDATGRMTAVTQIGNGVELRTEYAYDSRGNRIANRDANGNETHFEYDGLGRLTATVLPMGQRSERQYDLSGNISSRTDANGATITSHYDARNRLSARLYPDGSQVLYEYTATGRLAAIHDPLGTTSMSYDARDRLMNRTEPDGSSVSYTYDKKSNITGIQTDVGGALRLTSYEYDPLGRLATVWHAAGGRTDYLYDQSGNLLQISRPDGTLESRLFNERNQLLAMQTIAVLTGEAISGFQYTLDEVGNRLAVEELDGQRVEYAYDELYRLIGESIFDPGSLVPDRITTYTYDNVGNRLTRNDSVNGMTLYSYDINDRLIEETVGGQSTLHTHDANGNLLSRQSLADSVFYEWDFDNRLRAVDMNGDGLPDVEYRYDAAGMRVTKIVAGEETRFLLDRLHPHARVLEEYVPGDGIKVSYDYGHDLLMQERAGATSYFHADGLGSIRALTDGLGKVTDHFRYDAFGQLTERQGDTDNDYLFAGQQRDAETGFDYLRARYLDSSNGRFVSQDSFPGTPSDPLSFHRYLYAHANPVVNTDPSGQFTLLGVSVSSSIQSILQNIGRSRHVQTYRKVQTAADSLETYANFFSGLITFAMMLQGVVRQVAGQQPGNVTTTLWQASEKIPVDENFSILVGFSGSRKPDGVVDWSLSVGSEVGMGDMGGKWANAVKNEATFVFQGMRNVSISFGGSGEFVVFERPGEDLLLTKRGWIAKGTLGAGINGTLDFTNNEASAGQLTFEFSVGFFGDMLSAGVGLEGFSPYLRIAGSRLSF